MEKEKKKEIFTSFSLYI